MDTSSVAKKQTAFVLDESVAAASDGAHIPGIPGIWRHDEPISAEALGLGVQEFRDIIADLNLPLHEVQVTEGKAALFFTRATGDDRLDSVDLTVLPGGRVADPAMYDTPEETLVDIEQADARRVVDATVEARVGSDEEGA